jgi:hypothetical protein
LKDFHKRREILFGQVAGSFGSREIKSQWTRGREPPWAVTRSMDSKERLTGRK